MKIKMRVSFSGAGFTAGPGDEIERPNDEAIRLIKKGYADPLGAMPVEKAINPAPPEAREAPPPPSAVWRQGRSRPRWQGWWRKGANDQAEG